MNIALDFDRTYTLNPEFWDDFITKCQAEGHDIRMVTVRDDRYDRTAMIAEMETVLPVIYTRGVGKRWWVGHFAEGWSVDVWVDDKPESITENSPTTPEDLLLWRHQRGEGPVLTSPVA